MSKINSNIDLTTKLAKKIRQHVLNMTNIGHSSHIGSIFSVADILAVLYGSVLKYRFNEHKWHLRDRFVLSKGHAGAGVYAALAESGFFPIEKLSTYYQNGSDLSGHISHKKVPGVELSSGSLGHGLSVAVGMATAAKLNKNDHRVFVLLSDGECDEGSIWEAIMFASHNELNNLLAIVDRNRLQSILSTEETISLEPFVDKWKAFGWNVVEVNAHNHQQLIEVLSKTQYTEKNPLVVIANSTKGKGVSFMENSTLWHYRSPQGEEYKLAMEELK